jgi:hypothetical protein
MPKSKHRRKPNEKAVAHPGRGKPGKPVLGWLEELEATTSTAGLPLFDWADGAPPSLPNNLPQPIVSELGTRGSVPLWAAATRNDAARR